MAQATTATIDEGIRPGRVGRTRALHGQRLFLERLLKVSRDAEILFVESQLDGERRGVCEVGEDVAGAVGRAVVDDDDLIGP